MIAFDCENCKKPLMAPEAKGGCLYHCPSCHSGQIVPKPVRSPLRHVPWVKIFFLSIALVGVLSWLGYRAWRENRAAFVEKEFQETLYQHSPSWAEIEWPQCDVLQARYRVSARYYAGEKTYYLVATSLGQGEQTSIQIDPKADQSLAHAIVSMGQIKTFDYDGQSLEERHLLTNLALDMDDALVKAIQLVREK